MKPIIRVGNAQAFWGDKPSAAYDLLRQEPELDYLTMDYLAEVSMSILASQRERDSKLGYAQDFVHVVRSLADYWASGGRCRLIANAGGLNAMACAVACRDALQSHGCRSLKIGVVSGDDVLQILKISGGSDVEFKNLDNGHSLSEIQGRIVTSNAYQGCTGIVDALNAGADIVITGRVADPSMVVGACVHAFDWRLDDWSRLAGATVAGHLLECGTHATGGIATDWLSIPNITNLGFPIAEIDSEGEFVLTKSQSAGGTVSEATVKEQLVYEIGDPGNYISPDVQVSFLGLQLQPVGVDRIRVSGAIGSKAPSTLKVSSTFRDGYRACGTLTIIGVDAVAKAKRCGSIILKRLDHLGCRFRDSIIECLGNAESVLVKSSSKSSDLIEQELTEVVLRIAVESDNKSDVDQFTRELMPMVTAGPQGTTGYAEGRPRTHEVFRYWPCLINRDFAKPVVEMIESTNTLAQRKSVAEWPTQSAMSLLDDEQKEPDYSRHIDAANKTRRLIDVAYARSGDKGTGANIGVLARSNADYSWLCDWLTADRVKEYFQPIGVENVQRYEIPNLGGLNFVLRGILRRGIRNDTQGKALAQTLLLMQLD